MAEEITVRFRWTLAEVTEAARWHLRQKRSWRIRVGFCLVLAVLCAVLAWRDYERFGTLENAWLSLAGMAYFLLLAAFLRWFVIWRMRRSFARGTGMNKEIEWRISESELHASTPHAASELSWDAFNKAVLTPRGLLFYSQPLIFHWLPRHAFASEADFQAAAALARKGISVFQELS
jgi:hypothetical protein